MWEKASVTVAPGRTKKTGIMAMTTLRCGTHRRRAKLPCLLQRHTQCQPSWPIPLSCAGRRPEPAELVIMSWTALTASFLALHGSSLPYGAAELAEYRARCDLISSCRAVQRQLASWLPQVPTCMLPSAAASVCGTTLRTDRHHRSLLRQPFGVAQVQGRDRLE